jgi:glycosyltransferase involved in cell wall biosynthesis
MQSVLFICPIFAPAVKAGVFRPLAFARYLPEFGYQPLVVAPAVLPGAPRDENLAATLTRDTLVHTFDLPHAREGLSRVVDRSKPLLRFAEKAAGVDDYALVTSLRKKALAHSRQQRERDTVRVVVRLCRRLIRQHGPPLIWATAPDFYTLKAATVLKRRYGLKFVADYRDPWTYGVLWKPTSTAFSRRERRWERRVLEAADRVVFTSAKTQARMAGLYPSSANKFTTIPNGFEDVVCGVESSGAAQSTSNGHCPNKRTFELAFVGRTAAYRDPAVLFDALQLLAQEHPQITADLRMRFVGVCVEAEGEAARRGLRHLVHLDGPVDFATSQQVMRNADLLVLLQTIDGPGDDVIAGKTYEYLAAGRPILAIVGDEGGDAWLLRQANVGVCVGISDPARIASQIRTYWQQWKSGTLHAAPRREWLQQFDRRHLTRRLADVFDGLLATADTKQCVLS